MTTSERTYMTSCRGICTWCHVSASQWTKAQMTPMLLGRMFGQSFHNKILFERKCCLHWGKKPQLVQICKCVYWWCPERVRQKGVVGLINKRDEIPTFISLHRIIHLESLASKLRNNANKLMTFFKLNSEQMLATSGVWFLKQTFPLWNHL